MLKIPRGLLYSHQLRWSIERDRLDASFLRIGSGFLTKPVLQEAIETNDRITQILTQIQMMMIHTHTPPLVEPPHLPMLKAQQSVPIYAHSKGGGNQLL